MTFEEFFLKYYAEKHIKNYLPSVIFLNHDNFLNDINEKLAFGHTLTTNQVYKIKTYFQKDERYIYQKFNLSFIEVCNLPFKNPPIPSKKPIRKCWIVDETNIALVFNFNSILSNELSNLPISPFFKKTLIQDDNVYHWVIPVDVFNIENVLEFLKRWNFEFSWDWFQTKIQKPIPEFFFNEEGLLQLRSGLDAFSWWWLNEIVGLSYDVRDCVVVDWDLNLLAQIEELSKISNWDWDWNPINDFSLLHPKIHRTVVYCADTFETAKKITGRNIINQESLRIKLDLSFCLDSYIYVFDKDLPSNFSTTEKSIISEILQIDNKLLNVIHREIINYFNHLNYDIFLDVFVDIEKYGKFLNIYQMSLFGPV